MLGLGLWLGAPGLVHAAPAPPPRLPRPTTLHTTADGVRLQLQPDGTLRHVDVEGRFVGIVYPDGRVELRDLPEVQVEFTTGIQTVDWMVNMARAIEGPGPHDRPDLEEPTPDPEDQQARLEAATQKIDHGPYGPPPILVGFKVRFGGVADRVLRQGQRKQTRAKQAFLEQTAPLREALARTQRHEDQRAARLRIGQELASVWKDRSRPLIERKRELFERWDECEEAFEAEAASDADAARGRGGEAMRRRIEAFVRSVAPPGSPEAFDAAELRRLNAGRRSRQRFDPYDASERTPDQATARDDPSAGVVAR